VYLVTGRKLEQLPTHSSKVIWTQDLRGTLICLCPWGPLKNHHVNYRKRAEAKVLESTPVMRKGKHQSRLEVSRNHKDTSPHKCNFWTSLSISEQQSCSSLDHHNVQVQTKRSSGRARDAFHHEEAA